jgi:hypothetical protein
LFYTLSLYLLLGTGNLLHPHEYYLLSGATVAVYFTLTHWRIAEKKDNSSSVIEAAKHSFTPEISYLRVIDPPVRPVFKKHISSSFDPYDNYNCLPESTKKPQFTSSDSSSSS